MFLETRRKVILVGHQVEKNLPDSCSCLSVLWKVELASYESGYLAKEMSKQSVEEKPHFFLLLSVKCKKRKLI